MYVLNKFSLKGKIALVTGGYGYLGKAFSEALEEAGAKVIVAGKDKGKFDITFPSTENIIFHYLDISSTESIKTCFDSIWNEYGCIDVLVNNAIYYSGQYPEKITDTDLSFSFDGILGSVYKCVREIAPFMKRQGGGNIINIASMYGVVVPNFKVYTDSCKENFNPPQYGALKAGVIQLTKFFAEYFIENNIRVNAISPGAFPSVKVQENREFIKRLSDSNPSQRIGTPDDLKGVVVFLASDASTYVIGQNIQVDGGWTIW